MATVRGFVNHFNINMSQYTTPIRTLGSLQESYLARSQPRFFNIELSLTVEEGDYASFRELFSSRQISISNVVLNSVPPFEPNNTSLHGEATFMIKKKKKLPKKVTRAMSIVGGKE